MRRLMVLAVGATVLLVAGASASPTSKGPRLDGSFRMTATILSNDIGIPPGTVTADTYVFKSTCPKGGCAKVG